MRVRYAGPSVGVDLLGPDDTPVRVMRGHSIEVPEDYGAGLVLQDGWAVVGGSDRETLARSLAIGVPGLSPSAAEALVKAGYSDTAALASATDEELNDVDGVGPATIATIRAVVPETGDD